MLSLKTIFVFLIFILAFHAVAFSNYWYWTIWWFDIPMHFFGGAWLAMVFLLLNFKFKILMVRPRGSTVLSDSSSKGSPSIPSAVEGLNGSSIPLLTDYSIAALITLSFVAFGGILWEFFEFFYDILISSRGYSGIAQLGAADTVSDLFFDLFGGLTAFAVFRSEQDY